MLKKVTHDVQYYAHNYFNNVAVQLQILLFLISIATLVYEARLIIRVACCNNNINEHGTFFKVESEVMVVVVLLLPPSSQCFTRCF